MPPFNIVIPANGGAVAVDRFAEEADRVLEARKESGLEEPAEQAEQVEAAVEVAKTLVSRGLVGSGGVYVVLGGHANPDHVIANLERLESIVSIGIYQRPAPVEPKKKQQKSGGGS